MSAASNYTENKLLDHSLRYSSAPYTGASTLYLGLFKSTTNEATTTANLEAGTLTDEVSGNGYSRQTVTFAAASSGTSASNLTATFTASGGSWGTITHVAVIDNSTSGNVLYAGVLNASKTIADGDSFQIASGNLTISLA